MRPGIVGTLVAPVCRVAMGAITYGASAVTSCWAITRRKPWEPIDTSMSRQAFVKGGRRHGRGLGLLGAAGVALADEASASAEADGEAGGAAASGMTASDYEGQVGVRDRARGPSPTSPRPSEAELVVVGAGYAGHGDRRLRPAVLACRPSSCRRRAWWTCRGGSNNATYSRVMEAAGHQPRGTSTSRNVYQEEIVLGLRQPRRLDQVVALRQQQRGGHELACSTSPRPAAWGAAWRSATPTPMTRAAPRTCSRRRTASSPTR